MKKRIEYGDRVFIVESRRELEDIEVEAMIDVFMESPSVIPHDIRIVDKKPEITLHLPF